jgi:hypothetical protein
MNLMEALPRRLQAITDGEGYQIKYHPEEQYILWALLSLLKKLFSLLFLLQTAF